MLMSKYRFILLSALLSCVAALSAADNCCSTSQQYYTPKKQMHFCAELSQLTQENYPTLNNYIGASYLMYCSYYFIKPMNQRLKIGLDVAWGDLHYANYKINYQTIEGAVFRYDFHTADIGVQVGVGVNFNLTRNWNLHARACYNPTLTGSFQEFHVRGAFVHYGTAGLTLTYRKFGVGVGVRFGNPAYREYDLGLLDEMELGSDGDSGLISHRPGMVSDSEVIPFKSFQLNASLIYAF